MSITKHQRWPLLLHDQARLEYGRLLWRRPFCQGAIAQALGDDRHPYAQRFAEMYRPWVEKVFDEELSRHGLSLRVIVREIPPVFGSFY